MKRFFKSIPLLAAFVAVASCLPVLAATNYGAESATPYVAAFTPLFGNYGVPRTGTMTLSLHDGAISGKYTGTSVAPDPLYDRVVPVTGSFDRSDNSVTLYIGFAITLRGTMDADGEISGTATSNGRLYDFVAAPRISK
jgi:hypothetical protein